ncbi:MAG: chloride channel protein [Streptococcaceae bacterium]|jgi:H+/Cl- antiporter ClcA|nr:chloride channel protein [Streptococcaceae bacterium]
MKKTIYLIEYFFKWTLLATIIGLASGGLVAAFLQSLIIVTNIRVHHTWLLVFLPLAGLLVTFLYQKYGKNAIKGNNLVIEQGQGGKERVPLRLIPLVFFGTVVAHLFGASVGREGTAVQMGGALADVVRRIFKFDLDVRKILIVIGMGSGFSAIFGTPLAGTIFALEVLVVGRLETMSIYPVFLASLIANATVQVLGVHHTHYQIKAFPDLSVLLFAKLLVAGICFGLIGGLFAKIISTIKRIAKEKIGTPYRVIFIGSLVITLFGLFITQRYLGLSLNLLDDAFNHRAHWYDFLGKFAMTVFSLGIGFQGGEVTPLFEIGATLGANLASILQLPLTYLVAIGYVSVFSAATNTPIACLIMGFELFGERIALPLFFVIIVSFLCSGRQGIYNAQILQETKGKVYQPFLKEFMDDFQAKIW